MPQTLAEAYRPALACIAENGVPHACIGTYGLYLHGALPLDYVLSDADVLVDVDSPALQIVFDTLSSEGWQFLLWNDPVETLPDAQSLREHYYLRATRGLLCIDLAFGGMPLDNADILERAVEIGGIRVACSADIVAMKQIRGSAADLAVLRAMDGCDCGHARHPINRSPSPCLDTPKVFG